MLGSFDEVNSRINSNDSNMPQRAKILDFIQLDYIAVSNSSSYGVNLR